MRILVLVFAMALATTASAGELVINTPNYRIIGHGCALEYMAWIEPPGRNFGKIGARGCSHYTLYLSSWPQPAQIDPHVTVGLIDLPIEHFECMVTGISRSPEQIDVWCVDALFGKR